jgi:23S rRNA A2030 N6-methylase RlmJ
VAGIQVNSSTQMCDDVMLNGELHADRFKLLRRLLQVGGEHGRIEQDEDGGTLQSLTAPSQQRGLRPVPKV